MVRNNFRKAIMMRIMRGLTVEWIDTSLSVFCNGHIKQLQQAIKEGSLICYTEGEKDCLTLWKYGYISFTCGAVRTFKQAILPYLKGANVIVFGDDDGAGRADADRIAGLINTVGQARVIIRQMCQKKAILQTI